MEMANYYERLNLNAEMSIEEINSKLDSLETVWNRRLMQEPEKANEILNLIADARTVFADEASKADYDCNLHNSNESNESQAEYQEAQKAVLYYFKSRQWDLAELSLQKLLPLMDKVKVEDKDIYRTAIEIYLNTDAYEKALSMANRAILESPDSLIDYKNKIAVLFRYIEYQERKKADFSHQIELLAPACQALQEKAHEQKNNPMETSALEFLALRYTNYPPVNYHLAKQYANAALQINPNSANAKNVINLLENPRIAANNELKAYDAEICSYDEKIEELKKLIIEKNKGSQMPGWVLAEFETFIQFGPNSEYPNTVSIDNEYLVLTISGSFVRLTSENSIDLNGFRRFGLHPSGYFDESYTAFPGNPYWNDFLKRFDFNSKVHLQRDGKIEDSNWLSYYSFVSNYGYTCPASLYRNNMEKGAGLLKKLEVIYQRNIAPGYFNDNQKEQAEKELQAKKKREENARRIQMMNQRKTQGLCPYCGGEFKGFLMKKCVNCGKPKDY